MQQKKIKLAFITDGNAKDINVWSGTLSNIANALEKQKDVEIYYIENLKYKRNYIILAMGMVYAKILRQLGKQYLYGWTINIAKKYAKEIDKKLPKDIDVVFATSGCAAATAFGYLQSKCKKVVYTDMIYIDLFNDYPVFNNLCSKSKQNVFTTEKNKFANCDLFLFASDWAANSAINNYKINPSKVKVIPFGANIERNVSDIEIQTIIKNRPTDKCNLLFVGRDWKYKGGDIAVEIAKELHSQNINVHLNIVGINDIPVHLPDYVTNHGFISKKTEEGKNKLNKLFEEAHFFVLPTRFDAFGIVYAEASSFAVPSIATKTGGVATVVKDNINGMTFNLDDAPQIYADYIANLFNDRNEYEKLCLSAFNDYKTQLNWDITGKQIVDAVKEIF